MTKAAARNKRFSPTQQQRRAQAAAARTRRLQNAGLLPLTPSQSPQIIWWYTPTCGTATTSSIYTPITSTSPIPVAFVTNNIVQPISNFIKHDDPPPRVVIRDDVPRWYKGEISLPDGAKLICNKGKYHIEDKDARITYAANRNREFNRYVNASDLLEEFVRYLASEQLTKKEAMGTPIELFILWLILRAAETDGEEPPEQERLALATALEHKKENQK